MYWRAISLCSSLSATWAPNDARVASVTWLLLTSPVAFPAFPARSNTVGTGFSSASMPTAPLNVLTPVAMAVPPAAESVTNASGSRGLVSDLPAYGMESMAN